MPTDNIATCKCGGTVMVTGGRNLPEGHSVTLECVMCKKRLEGRPHPIWNVAQNMAINQWKEESGVK